ncbi:MAG: hypothetical protein AB7V04_01625 [Desulfomonilaceae bacterium]
MSQFDEDQVGAVIAIELRWMLNVEMATFLKLDQKPVHVIKNLFSSGIWT